MSSDIIQGALKLEFLTCRLTTVTEHSGYLQNSINNYVKQMPGIFIYNNVNADCLILLCNRTM